MNKGLELIEAARLFGLHEPQIDVLVHPQSVIHGMVCYRDGSVLAQLGSPDMRIPIAHTLAWPERMARGRHASISPRWPGWTSCRQIPNASQPSASHARHCAKAAAHPLS